ncbi:hypothetical protein [cf. Phormidesmis sp. LEGE 11477]|uniref:hypothetical protein n=1 Tax=cf. Phormidesmis sp. LEGE 11477 TaxID=1828680 RepID=UPI0018802041|nr:hypothetical protein [cf. Phormidesmis sp. LEGE 11477]MBE9063255.1 hypothetical protein [cf. Phormidesmis sp. LEGE 11477]
MRSEMRRSPQRSKSVIANLLKSHHDRVLIPWVDCCNGNGYQRERALRAMGKGAPNSFLFAILLRRLNDWVPEVRTAARECIPAIIRKTDLEYVLEALWGVLPHLYSWGRLQTEDKQVIVDILGYQDIPEGLSEKIITAPAGPAPMVLSQVGKQPAFDRFLLDISTRAVQPAVRAKAYKSQLDESVSWIEGYQWKWIDKRWCKGRFMPVVINRDIQVARPFIQSLEAAATDKSVLVRRVAGNALFSETGSPRVDVASIAKMLASDPYPSISERGKFGLKRLDG